MGNIQTFTHLHTNLENKRVPCVEISSGAFGNYNSHTHKIIVSSTGVDLSKILGGKTKIWGAEGGKK